MSYILDALRKSDAQRRLGQSPDLGSVPPGAAPPPRFNRGPFRAGLVLVIVLVAAATVFVFTREDADPDTKVVDAPAEQPIVDEARDDAPVAPAVTDGEPTDPDPEAAMAAAEPPPPEDRRSPAQQPVTVVSRPAARRPGERPVPTGERERVVESAEEAQRLIEAELAASADAAREAEGVREPAPAHEPESVAETVPAPPPEPEPEAWTPERSDFVRVWDLPLSVRRDLPKLDLSIHVFSSEPESRFVLINGERRIEGDELEQGARLIEIRRDGALVDFRDYRFLLEP